MSDSKRRDNLRLAWMLAGVGALIFLLALWKFRPL